MLDRISTITSTFKQLGLEDDVRNKKLESYLTEECMYLHALKTELLGDQANSTMFNL